jgi:hypothetical protein
MAEVAKRFRQTLQLKRDAFVWMSFNDRATGDALILVALTPVVVFLVLAAVSRNLFAGSLWRLLIDLVLAALIQWLLYSGIAWAIVTYGFRAGAEFSTYLRFSGFAYPTTVLVAVLIWLLDARGLLSFALGHVWFVLIIMAGMGYTSDLSRDKALLAAVGSLVALLLIDQLVGLSPLI